MTTMLSGHRAVRRAFSLVEMVIVIGIIVLLVGLTVAVLASLTRGSETRRTQDMLTLIDAAYQEWKNVAERDITYGVDDTPQVGVTYEVAQDVSPGNADDHEATDEVISDLLANAQSKAILANIDSELLRPERSHPASFARCQQSVMRQPGQRTLARPRQNGVPGQR